MEIEKLEEADEIVSMAGSIFKWKSMSSHSFSLLAF